MRQVIEELGKINDLNSRVPHRNGGQEYGDDLWRLERMRMVVRWVVTLFISRVTVPTGCWRLERWEVEGLEDGGWRHLR
jgi:hypothetical protein